MVLRPLVYLLYNEDFSYSFVPLLVDDKKIFKGKRFSFLLPRTAFEIHILRQGRLSFLNSSPSVGKENITSIFVFA